MFIPIRTDYRLSQRPWINYALLAANILIYLAGFNGASRENIARIDALLLHPDAMELSQFFTSVFLHGSFLHLFGNMVFLWVFGNAINDRLGHIGYLAFYLAGGVLAGVGYVIFSGNAPVLGASGAIAAVTGAYLVLFPRTRVTLLMIFYFITAFEVPALWFLLFQFAFEMYMSVTPSLFGGSENLTVAHWAHSSGYLFGIGISFLLLWMRLLPRDAFDLLNLIHSWRRRQKYRRMVSQGFDPFQANAGLRSRDSRVRARTVESEPARTSGTRELQLRREISRSCQRGDIASAAGLYLQLVQVAEDVVLARQQQLDVANQLMAQQRYPQAADAYERFLRHYANYEYTGDIHLMLGIIYSRYLQQYDQAEDNLSAAIERLHDPQKRQMAEKELQGLRSRRR
jgi:membrane associated rhomboid family serine protease